MPHLFVLSFSCCSIHSRVVPSYSSGSLLPSFSPKFIFTTCYPPFQPQCLNLNRVLVSAAVFRRNKVSIRWYCSRIVLHRARAKLSIPARLRASCCGWRILDTVQANRGDHLTHNTAGLSEVILLIPIAALHLT